MEVGRLTRDKETNMKDANVMVMVISFTDPRFKTLLKLSGIWFIAALIGIYVEIVWIVGSHKNEVFKNVKEKYVRKKMWFSEQFYKFILVITMRNIHGFKNQQVWFVKLSISNINVGHYFNQTA